MSKVLVSEENLTNIANSIREKTGTEDTYKPSEMASAISSIEAGASVPEKGIVINEWNENGFPTSLTVVGMTDVPNYYLSTSSNSSTHFLDVVTEIILPEGIQTLGNNCLNGYDKLLQMELPESLTSIGNYTFSGNTGMVISHIPDGVTSIGDSAFYKCYAINITELPSALNHIGSSAFDNCRIMSITKVPEGVTEIASSAFYSCRAIATLELSGPITAINSKAFNDCTKLSILSLPNVTEVPTLGATIPFGNSTWPTPIYKGTGYIYVPDTLVESFKSATNWSTYADQILPISELPTE